MDTKSLAYFVIKVNNTDRDMVFARYILDTIKEKFKNVTIEQYHSFIDDTYLIKVSNK